VIRWDQVHQQAFLLAATTLSQEHRRQEESAQ